MAGDVVAPGVAPGPAVEHCLGEYLSGIAARLPGPRRARTAALAELRDGLLDAVEAHRARGATAGDAARAAVAESGPIDVVAAAYAPILAARQARRSALALVATGPAIGLLWVLALVPGQAPDALLRMAPPLLVAVAVATVAALLAIAAAGRGMRWLPDTPQLPQRATATACAAAIAGDLIVLTLAATQLLATGLPVAPALLAAAASLTRLGCSQHAARRVLRDLPERATRSPQSR